VTIHASEQQPAGSPGLYAHAGNQLQLIKPSWLLLLLLHVLLAAVADLQ